MNTPLVATVTPALSTLTLTGDLITNNQNVTKNGAGTFVVKNVRTAFTNSLSTTGGLTVSAGTLRIASNGGDAGVSKVSRLSIAGATDAWTARLDLANNGAVIDYPTAGPSVLDTIQNQIKGGFNNGAWGGNGIDSSAAAATSTNATKTALGYGEASTILGASGGTFKGQTVDGTAILIGYTLFGDANLDLTVDTTDFNNLAANFSQPGKHWTDGDFNYDGTVDTTDFNLLASNFSQTLPGTPALGALVPEPGAMAMIALASGALLRRKRP